MVSSPAPRGKIAQSARRFQEIIHIITYTYYVIYILSHTPCGRRETWCGTLWWIERWLFPTAFSTYFLSHYAEETQRSKCNWTAKVTFYRTDYAPNNRLRRLRNWYTLFAFQTPVTLAVRAKYRRKCRWEVMPEALVRKLVLMQPNAIQME